MDQQNGTRDQRQYRNRHFRCTRLHEQWSSTRLGLGGFGAQHQGEQCRFLRTWASARWSPRTGLARQERFLPDIAATVLEVLYVTPSSSGWPQISRPGRGHSGRSSKKSMPWCASDTSPGRNTTDQVCLQNDVGRGLRKEHGRGFGDIHPNLSSIQLCYASAQAESPGLTLGGVSHCRHSRRPHPDVVGHAAAARCAPMKETMALRTHGFTTRALAVEGHGDFSGTTGAVHTCCLVLTIMRHSEQCFQLHDYVHQFASRPPL
jgi:hypothetical protein